MAKPVTLFDDAFNASAVESQQMLPVRLLLAVGLTVLGAFSLGWSLALEWAAAVAVSEAWTVSASWRAYTGRSMTPFGALSYLISALAMSCVYGGIGVLLWGAGKPAYEIAAVAMWTGQMIYAQNFCTKSKLLLAAIGVPTVLTPVLTPILLPRFHGAEQVIVVTMLALCVGHVLNAVLINLRAARRLRRATNDLVQQTREAERAKAEMADAKVSAEAANQAKSGFLATMSHEIRTPLNGVLGMAQAMAADDLPPEQRRRLDVVRQSGESLLAILNDILDLSKIEAGKLSLELIDFDLGDIIQAARATFTALTDAKGLAFVVDIDAARGAYHGDPTRLRQILHNLVSNAVKFTEAGEVRLTARHDDGRLAISVSDTGVGIPADAVGGLFAKFSQAEASTSRRFGGTGLGLSICRELAELMGGTIAVESRLGEGSRFTLVVPLPAAEREVAASPARSGAAFGGGLATIRLLAAEDNAINQLVLKTLLAQIGIEPVLVDNGAAAVEAWRRANYDLVLMDVQMPVMDGLAAAAAIRRLEVAEGRTRTPIIALTANAMSHQIAEYLAAGMDDHVAKPIEARRLYDAVAMALDTGESEDATAADPSIPSARARTHN